MPLHMTTRKAAKKAQSTSPVQGDSTEDDSSRRASFDGITGFVSYDDYDLERPSKRQRTSDHARPKSASMLLAPKHTSTRTRRRSAGLGAGNDEDSSSKANASGGLFASQHASNRADGDSVAGGQASQDGSAASLSALNGVLKGGATQASGDTVDDQDVDIEDRERMRYEASNGSDIEDEHTDVYTRYRPVKTRNQVKESYQAEHEGDWVELASPAPSPQHSNSREGSVASSTRGRTVANSNIVVAMSTDVTPMATQPASPATTGSAAAEDETPLKSKVVGLDADNSSEDEAEEVEPVAPTQDTVEEVTEMQLDVEEDAEEGGVTHKVTKRRFPGGRRRAAHSNTLVEAALRRQLELKQTYRQVARAMKACLGELAQVTLDELETGADPAEAAEYRGVMAGLDARLAARKEQLLTAAKSNKQQLLQRYEGEAEARRKRCRNAVEDLQDQQLVNLEFNMLQVQRAQLLEETKSGHETEDEDGVIPRPKRMAYRWKRSGAMDHRYDSRSRFTLETERMVDDLQHRNDMFEALRTYEAAQVKETPPSGYSGYTVMDSSVREAADERRKDVDATKQLAQIAEEYRQMYATPPPPPPPPPPPRPEELVALNTLAELAVRPSVSMQRQTPVAQPPQMPPYPFNFPFQGFPGMPPPPPPPPFAFSALRAGTPAFQPYQSAPPGHVRQRSMSAMSHPSTLFPTFENNNMRPPSTPRQYTMPSPRFGPPEIPPGAPSSGIVARGVDGMPPLAAKPASLQDRLPNEMPAFSSAHNEPFLGAVHPSRRQFFSNQSPTTPEMPRDRTASESNPSNPFGGPQQQAGAPPGNNTSMGYGSAPLGLPHSFARSAPVEQRRSSHDGLGHARMTPALPHNMGHLMLSDQPQRSPHTPDSGTGSHKPSLEERGGMSRKAHKQARKESIGWVPPQAKPVNHFGPMPPR